MIDHIARHLALGAALALPGTASSAANTSVWPDTPLARAEALTLLQSLNTALLSHDSATLTLDDWCQRYHLAEPDMKIVAERVRGQDKPAGADQRNLLRVGPDEPIRYRRVRLRCGARVLSEADNWYVPSRLTSEMNAALEGSDIAFGRAVQRLHFHRLTLSARLLWSPLTDSRSDGDMPIPRGSSGTLVIPAKLIEHQAVLSLPDGTPFSEVVETYTGAVLDFPPSVLIH